MDIHLDGLFSENSTFDYGDYVYQEDVDQKSSRIVWIPVLYSLVLAVGLVGNILLLAILVQKRRSWRSSDTFILHLSITDLLLLGTLPFRAAEAAGWTSQTLCKICGALFNINFFCGILLLVCLGLDHALSTAHNVRLFPPSKPRRVHFSCLCVWIISLLLSLPDWMFLSDVTTQCVYTYTGTTRMLSRHFHHVFAFLLPSALLVLCCSSLLLQLKCSLKSLWRKKAPRLLFLLLVLFFICWLPYNITLIVDTVTHDYKEAPHAALTVTAVLGCMHACVRPLLYLGLSKNFRKRSLATLRCILTDIKDSLWELVVGEEALDHRNQAAEGLKQEHQTPFMESLSVLSQRGSEIY